MSDAATRVGSSFLVASLVGLVLFLAGCATQPAGTSGGAGHEERDAAIMQVLDQYMDGLNAHDLESHVATYHFPHFRYASGNIAVWQTPVEALPILNAPRADRLAALQAALEPDWHRSEWTRRDIVQGDAGKVHVVTQFVRLREDGSVIKTFDSLYVMTLETDAEGKVRWGIRGRSSFAP